MSETLRGPALIDGELVADTDVEIEGDRIVRASRATAEPGPGRHRVSGGTMVPGYIDLHCHGGGGTAFTDLTPDAAEAAARHHHSRGTTSLLASLVTMTTEDLERGVAILADLADDGLIDGIHLEGPWISRARCGAHDPALVRDPTLTEVERLLEAGRGHVKQVTLAPERHHGVDLVGWLTSAGVHAAVGHTAAPFERVEAAVEAGADLATHLFNGMDPWHHRSPGPVPALLHAAARSAVTVELIADGIHLSDDTVRTVLALVGASRVAFVSDAMAAAGIGDGSYRLGGSSVVVSDGVARLERDPDGTSPGSIAGGTSHVADLVARAVGLGLPLPDAVRCGAGTAAQLLGLGDRGALRAGARADIVVLGPAFEVVEVMREGRWIAPR